MEFINTCFETTNSVRALAYYSHILPGIGSMALGFFAFYYAKKRMKATLFLLFTILLSLWLLGDLITWTSNNYYIVAGFWAPLDMINILFFLAILTFIVVDFSYSQKIPWYILIFVLLASIPPFILTFSGLAVFEFDEPNCEMIGNQFLSQYKLVIEWIIIFGILIAGALAMYREYKVGKSISRILLVTLSSSTFLALFASSEYFSTLTGMYEITLYSLFALPIFIMLLTYTIVEQGTFNLSISNIWFVRLLFFIFILVSASDLFLANNFIQILINAASLVVTLGFGFMLMRSANRESIQKQEIQLLANKLEKANKRLQILDQMKSEFVSIASHQLRSPLTSIRGYASMLLEGSYGKLSIKGQEAVHRISESSRLMAKSVEDYLNVSRIQAGHMKYELSDFNLKDLIEHITNDMRTVALRKGLLLNFKSSDMTSRGFVHADQGKVTQIINNLIDNAIKYTPKGRIDITIRDNKKKKVIYIDVADSGVGMSKEALEEIFEKFVRAKNANSVNVTGTGLGLFVAKQMAEGMGGSITPCSEGEGLGSTFTLQLPLIM
jgi:signal transduction histidine kinase